MKLAGLAPDPEQQLALLDAGLAADPDIETLGMLRLNRAAVLQALERADEARDELVALLAMPELTPTAEAWARQLREQQ